MVSLVEVTFKMLRKAAALGRRQFIITPSWPQSNMYAPTKKEQSIGYVLARHMWAPPTLEGRNL